MCFCDNLITFCTRLGGYIVDSGHTDCNSDVVRLGSIYSCDFVGFHKSYNCITYPLQDIATKCSFCWLFLAIDAFNRLSLRSERVNISHTACPRVELATPACEYLEAEITSVLLAMLLTFMTVRGIMTRVGRKL